MGEPLKLFQGEYLDPQEYVPREIKLGKEEKKDITDIIADYYKKKLRKRRRKGALYIIWGLPGTGKSTIARQVAYLLASDNNDNGWRALHIMLRYEDRIVIPKSNNWEKPPALVLDSSRLPMPNSGSQSASKRFDDLIGYIKALAIGPSGETLEEFLERTNKMLESVIANERESPLLRAIKGSLITLYVVGILPIDVSGAIKEISERLKGYKLKQIPGLLAEIFKEKIRRVTSTGQRRILLIIDDIDSDEKAAFAGTLMRTIRGENIDTDFLIVYTITESKLLELKSQSSRVSWNERITYFIAEKLGLSLQEVQGRILPMPIMPPSIPEIRKIVSVHLGHEEASSLSDKELEDLASHCGWHLSLIINTIKIIKESESSDRPRFFPDIVIRMRDDEEEEIMKVVYRYLQLMHLVSELANIDVSFIGLLLQPMGISTLETERFCERLYKSKNRKFSEFLNVFFKGSTSPTCSFDSIRALASRGWEDIIITYDEKWCKSPRAALRIGAPFYHIPMLLADYEKALADKEKFINILDEYFDSASKYDILSRSNEFIKAIKYARSELLAVEKELLTSPELCIL